MTDVRVRVEGVSKQFLTGLADGVGMSASSLLRYYAPLLVGAQPSASSSKIWALDDVSFSVEAGEVVGIVGRNGSGKSTLLKVLSRITSPTRGRFSIKGRVGSLLEIGTGFHPDLTGRQNVYLNGAILGMSSQEISRRFDEIVSFAEIGQFIDTPVRHYSSGMYMRLAFAVAAHLDCDVLLVDEVLAVGDIKFQRKCLDLMRNSIKSGKTVFFVSHSSAIVLQVCTRAILLDAGRMIADGTPHAVLEQYVTAGTAVVGEKVFPASTAPAFSDASVVLRAARLKDGTGEIRTQFDVKEPIQVEIDFEVLRVLHPINVHIYIANDNAGKLMVSMDNLDTPWNSEPVPQGLHTALCYIPADFLNEGLFMIEVVICTCPTSPQSLSAPDVLLFQVLDDMKLAGVRGNWEREWPPAAIRPRLRWSHRKIQTLG